MLRNMRKACKPSTLHNIQKLTTGWDDTWRQDTTPSKTHFSLSRINSARRTMEDTRNLFKAKNPYNYVCFMYLYACISLDSIAAVSRSCETHQGQKPVGTHKFLHRFITFGNVEMVWKPFNRAFEIHKFVFLLCLRIRQLIMSRPQNSVSKVSFLLGLSSLLVL